MSTASQHPTRDELLAMAYVDGELTAEAQAEIEARLPREPELARAVARYQRIEVAARAIAPEEPADHEWERLRRDPVQRTGLGLGWTLFVLGAIAAAVWVALELYRAEDLGWPFKVAIGLVAAGALLLLGMTVRARLRTLPYDPYTEVKR